MYDELIQSLRCCADDPCDDCKFCGIYMDSCDGTLKNEAADAIEALDKDTNVPSWIPIESRPMDEDERQYYSEHFGYEADDYDAIIYCCPLPDDGQEVIVCNMYGHVWIDTFSNDPDYGVGFEENGDMDGIVAWMPKPKPYKPPKEE